MHGRQISTTTATGMCGASRNTPGVPPSEHRDDAAAIADDRLPHKPKLARATHASSDASQRQPDHYETTMRYAKVAAAITASPAWTGPSPDWTALLTDANEEVPR